MLFDMLRIKEILKEKNITSKYLAERLKMTEVGLSKAIGEKGNPSLKRLREIADVLDVPVSDLFVEHSATITCPNCKTEITISVK